MSDSFYLSFPDLTPYFRLDKGNSIIIPSELSTCSSGSPQKELLFRIITEEIDGNDPFYPLVSSLKTFYYF